MLLGDIASIERFPPTIGSLSANSMRLPQVGQTGPCFLEVNPSPSLSEKILFPSGRGFDILAPHPLLFLA